MNWLAMRGFVAAILVAAIGLIIRLIKRDVKKDGEIKDATQAIEIYDRLSDDQSDPDRLRPYEGAGWRD